MSSNIVVQHGHCVICGKAMTFDPSEKTCSDECKGQLKEQARKRKRFVWMMLGFAALAMFLSIYGSVPR